MPHIRFRLTSATLPLMLLAGAVGADAQTSPFQLAQTPVVAERSASDVIQRWFDVPAVTLMARYRRVESSEGFVNANHMQDGFLFRARLKLDQRGRYSVSGGWATGQTFTGAWNNVGWGTGGPRTTGVYMKQFYFTAAPMKGLELSYGGFGIARGESTEITTYDNDGYSEGVRGTIKRPSALYLDELTVTSGYLGDLAWPSFWDRYNRLADWNYLQMLGVKKVARGSASISGDYSRVAGVNLYRGAANVKTPFLRVIDSVRYEQYCRAKNFPACGFAGTLEKAVTKHLTLSGGFADVDQHYGNANADRFLRGRRFFELASVKVLNDFVVSAFATQAVYNDFVIPNGHRFDLAVTYNALGPLQRAGLFR